MGGERKKRIRKLSRYKLQIIERSEERSEGSCYQKPGGREKKIEQGIRKRRITK